MGGERALVVIRKNWEGRFELKVKPYVIDHLIHLLRQVTNAKLTKFRRQQT